MGPLRIQSQCQSNQIRNKNPTLLPENGQGSYVILEGRKFKTISIQLLGSSSKGYVHFVRKYKTTRNAEKYKLFQTLKVINPYCMLWGIKTQALLVLSMFHCSLFKLVYLPTQLDLILIFCYKSRN